MQRETFWGDSPTGTCHIVSHYPYIYPLGYIGGAKYGHPEELVGWNDDGRRGRGDGLGDKEDGLRWYGGEEEGI